MYTEGAFHIDDRKGLDSHDSSYLLICPERGSLAANFLQDYGCPPDTWAPKGQGNSHCFNEEPGHAEPSRTVSALGSKKIQTCSATRKVPKTRYIYHHFPDPALLCAVSQCTGLIQTRSSLAILPPRQLSFRLLLGSAHLGNARTLFPSVPVFPKKT